MRTECSTLASEKMTRWTDFPADSDSLRSATVIVSLGVFSVQNSLHLSTAHRMD